MPFTKAQHILKMLLPQWFFRIIYKFVRYCYRLWCKISDTIYYKCALVYYNMTGQSENASKIKLISSIRPFTMVSRNGLLTTFNIAMDVEKSRLAGCFVECGVARGGCSALMAMVTRQYKSERKMWLFDSFEGLPEPGAEDASGINLSPDQNRSSSELSTGYCLGTYEQVGQLLYTTFKLDKKNVFMVKGWFQDTLPTYKNKIGGVAFLRLDGDWYESTKCCLNNLYDNVVVGGYILIDDFHLPGCKKAAYEFLVKRGLVVDFISDGRGGAYFRKPQ